ncbi:hypothetical protein [Nocardioides insulae]|uniref:hypothetical protein n=1 Tax=Nocardioides insulae TaxID=394734 RepID=UPI000490D603|nr:hypothetical protein [Nocardioides insulae]
MSSTAVRIPAPPRATFDFLAEPRNRPQWQSSLRTVEALTDGPTGVGTRWLDRTAIGAAPRLEITAMRPPSGTTGAGVWSETGHWRGLTASVTLEFLPVPTEPTGSSGSGGSGRLTDPAAATDVVVRLEVTGAGVWRVPAMILRLLAPPALRADLRRAARLLATGRPAPG